MESWILQVSYKVNVKPFGLHLLCTRPEVFMIPWTFQKLNSFLKYYIEHDVQRGNLSFWLFQTLRYVWFNSKYLENQPSSVKIDTWLII